MTKDAKHYKFINNETGNVIYFLSIPMAKGDAREILESTRHKLAMENGLYVGNIYYLETSKTEPSK